MLTNKYNGFAIALAWPSTYCKQSGAWYDAMLNFFGIAHKNYYKVGHAAIILVDKTAKKCHYFDFGRYQSPFGHGRVRNATTDHELEFFTRPEISENGEKIENFTEILSELQNREACHGSGDLYASYTAINFQKAQQKALEMQAQSPIAYGPFIPHGTNCSRFVLSVLLAGQPNLWHRLALRYFNPLTATPALNVRWLLHRRQMPKPHPEAAFIAPKLSPEALRSCLPAPEKPAQIPQNALWLAGEGAGSWFALNFDKNALHLQRYSPSGKLECSGIFRQTTQSTFDDTAPFQLSYPSDCQTITILQQQQPNVFTRE